METNLPLIIGLASGFAFLNFLLVLTWFLWERSRRKKLNKRQPDDKLTPFSWRPTKLHKARRPRIEENVVPDQWGQFPRNGPAHHTSYISSPLPVHHRPARGPVHHHTPGLSSLRNELYPSPPISIARRPSARTFDSASVYSTISAPSHLHDEILSDTPESFSTVVNSQDTHYMSEKYNTLPGDRYSVSMDPRDPLWAIQEWEPETLDRTYPRRWGPYLADEARSGTQPMLREQWQVPNSMLRHTPSVPPLNVRKRTPSPPFATVRQIPPARPPRCPSPHLPSPYSP